MRIIKCYMRQSTWYKGAENRKVLGVLWHSTAANNKTIKRYVQPDDNAKDREELINIIGKNRYGNDWNHIEHDAGVNAFIGTLADGSIATVETADNEKKAWGCGDYARKLKNGWSLNETHLQFEICEDSKNDINYFNKVYKEAVEYTAHICEKYGLDPLGYFEYRGDKIPVITDHAGSHAIGHGGNHGDVGHWFKRYLGENYMDKIRADVKKEMSKGGCDMAGCKYWDGTKCTKESTKAETSDILKVGDKVKLQAGAPVYNRSYCFSSWVYNATLYLRELSGNRAVISTLQSGAVTGAVDVKYLTKI